MLLEVQYGNKLNYEDIFQKWKTVWKYVHKDKLQAETN